MQYRGPSVQKTQKKQSPALFKITVAFIGLACKSGKCAINLSQPFPTVSIKHRFKNINSNHVPSAPAIRLVKLPSDNPRGYVTMRISLFVAGMNPNRY